MPSRSFTALYCYRQAQRAKCSLPVARKLLRGVMAPLADLLFPPVYGLCGRDIERLEDEPLLCPTCREELVTSHRPACPRCARPLPPDFDACPWNCPVCRKRRFRFERTTALGVYSGLMRNAVLRIKRVHSEPLAFALGGLLAKSLASDAPDRRFDLLAPVPMHWARRLLRGVNGPEMLTEAIASRLGVPAALDLLYCRRRTKKQGTLLPTERQGNVRGAYAVSPRYTMEGADVLLVDDVMTTGATANEITRLLLRAGAACVSIAVVARGVGFD